MQIATGSEASAPETRRTVRTSPRVPGAALSTRPVAASGSGSTTEMGAGPLPRQEPPLRTPIEGRNHPDHDNLDAKFNPMNLDTVDPWLWESYEVTRRIKLELTEAAGLTGLYPRFHKL